MIKNEKQYNISKKKLNHLGVSLKEIKSLDNGKNNLKIKIQVDSLSTDIKTLRKEISEFEKLKAGKIRTITAHSIQELPELLIKARIARSMSQKDLAESLGMQEQQIQRYESNNYAGASLSKIEKIVEALDLVMEEKARLV